MARSYNWTTSSLDDYRNLFNILGSVMNIVSRMNKRYITDVNPQNLLNTTNRISNSISSLSIGFSGVPENFSWILGSWFGWSNSSRYLGLTYPFKIPKLGLIICPNNYFDVRWFYQCTLAIYIELRRWHKPSTPAHRRPFFQKRTRLAGCRFVLRIAAEILIFVLTNLHQ